jgi:non-ribosomal peptide synthetase component F
MPIGKPLPGTELLVLDSQSRLLPRGLRGELYIGGEGLAQGYLNRNDLNAEKFINHPYRIGARLYRTGDAVSWNKQGELEFHGRLDHQIKLNGYRIELGEIEEVLLSCQDIINAAVLWNPSSKLLKAFYEGEPE